MEIFPTKSPTKKLCWAGRMSKFKYPHVAEQGKSSVTIRQITDKGYPAFRLEYYLDGVRRMKTRADEKKAHGDAKRILDMLEDRTPIFSQTEDATIYHAAQLALRDLGVPVDVAAREYAIAVKSLDGVPLAEAIAIYKKHQPARTGMNTPELVDKFLAALKPTATHAYYKNVVSRLNRFARHFTGPIHAITKSEIEAWLLDLGIASRSRNNERATIITFFRWARSERFLPQGVATEPESLKVAKTQVVVEIFSLDQAEKLMKRVTATHPDLTPYAAIGMFGGVRPEELKRLEFADVRWSHGDIEVAAHKAKTGTRRLVEMKPNLKQWLQPFAERRGLIADPKAAQQLIKIARKLKIKWVPDIMRHSFISYAVAEAQQIGQVALWAGNSEGIIKKHYLKRVTKDEGAAYFQISP